MDKGIIIGAEHESATRSNLSFVMFRHATSVSFPIDSLAIGSNYFTPIVSSVFASHPAIPARRPTSQGGCEFRDTLQGPGIFRARFGNPSPHCCGIGSNA